MKVTLALIPAFSPEEKGKRFPRRLHDLPGEHTRTKK
jgi:hypothetical protein